MGSFLFSRRSAIFSAIATFPALAFSVRAETNPAADLVVLTAGGLIDKPNRPPFDAAKDKFFNHNNLNFERAHSFRLSELAALPQHSVTSHDKADGASYAGPYLSDVLNLAGASAKAKTARFSALDGYAAEISLADVDSQKWILAMTAGENPLEIGGFGPLRVMREVSADVARQEDENQKWVYGLFYIEVMD